MHPSKTAHATLTYTLASMLLLVIAMPLRASAQQPQTDDPPPTSATPITGHDTDHASHATAANGTITGTRTLSDRLDIIARRFESWYWRTPPAERVTWGGLIACAALGVLVILERLARLRRRAIMPKAFTARLLDRLHGGKLDCGQALDLCELNPSPAANVALAAVRRWGRPSGDLERAVALAHRVETDLLRRNVGTLRRIAALAPLLGLLGTLFAVERILGSTPGQSTAWAPALAPVFTPLTAGIVIATLALVAYDALLIRIEKLAAGLDRLGAETIDAIAMSVPPSAPTMVLSSHGEPRSSYLRPDAGRPSPVPPPRSPHQPYFRVDDGTGLIRHSGETANDE